jgi:hypothetical protein
VILWSLKKQKGDEYDVFSKKTLLNVVIKCNKYPKNINFPMAVYNKARKLNKQLWRLLDH